MNAASVWQACALRNPTQLLQAVQALPTWNRESALCVHEALMLWCAGGYGSSPAQECYELRDLVTSMLEVHPQADLDTALSGASHCWKSLERMLNERLDAPLYRELDEEVCA